MDPQGKGWLYGQLRNGLRCGGQHSWAEELEGMARGQNRVR